VPADASTAATRAPARVSTRRDDILAGAAELFARNGIAATTVRDIGDAVGMLSGSLYHYFASKEEIVDAIVASYLDDLRARYRAVAESTDDPVARLRALIHASFHSVFEFPSACEIYQKDFSYLTQLPRFAYMKQTASETQQVWMATIEAGIEQGTFGHSLDPVIVYHFIRDAIWMSVRWLRVSGRYSVDEVADECCELFLNGFLHA
jgi:AcrR family transcriptional regulator